MRRVVLILILLVFADGLLAQVTITAQPVSVNPCFTAASQNTSFTVATSGAGATYQWEVFRAGSWQTLSNASVLNEAIYSGVTTATLVLSNVRAGAGGLQYRCIVSCATCTPQQSNSATLTLPFGLTPSFSGPLCSNRSLQFDANVSGGTGPFSYLWTFADGHQEFQKNNAYGNPTTATAGLATLAVTDGNGCVVIAEKIVVLESIYNPTVNVPANQCATAPFSLTATTTETANFYWTYPNSGGIGTQPTDCLATTNCQTNIVILPAGTYTFSLKLDNNLPNPNKCQTTINYSVVVQAPPVVAMNSVATKTICLGNTFDLDNATAGGSWTSSDNNIATVDNQGLITTVSAGTVTISYTVISGSCTNTSNTLVTVAPLPTISGTLSVCEAGSTTQLTGSATAHATTPWQTSAPGVATISTTGLVTGVAAGTALITYQNTNGCTKTATVTVNPLPTISGTLSVCEAGSTTQLTGSATAHATTPWQTSAPGVATISTTGLVTGVAAGTALITYQNTNGCTKTATVTVNPLPTISGTLSVCEAGSTTQLTGSATAHATTPWQTSAPGVATISTTGLVTGVAAGTALITYQNTNGCTKTATVTVNPLPTISGTLSVCEAGSTTQLTGSATAHTTTPWQTSAPGVATISTTGLVTGVAAGTALITYQNTNGCTKTATVTVNPLPTISGTLSVCEAGSTTQLTGSATAHTTTPWQTSAPGVATISTTGLVTGVAAGTALITYQNTNGCTKTATVTVNPLPTISGTLSVCEAGSTTQLTGSATAHTTTPWQTSAPGVATISTTGLVTGVAAGTALITYQNTNGCTKTATVTVNPLPTISGTLSVCEAGSTTQLTGSATAHTTTPWQTSAPGVATISTTGLVTGVAAGTALITYQNTNGCTKTATVTVNPLPTISGTLSVCEAGSTTQLTGSATAHTTTPWQTSAPGVATISTTGLVTGVAAGTALITYQNTNGCTKTATVTVNPLPTISGTLSVCEAGSTTQLTGSATAHATTPWASSNLGVATINSTGLVTGVAAGTTVITYQNTNGCTKTATVTVNASPLITIQPSTTTQSVCNNSTPTALSVTANAGSGSITNYQWYSNSSASNTGGTLVAGGLSQTSYTPSSASPGILYYYVIVTNSNGCTTTSNVSGAVTVNALPQVTSQPSVSPQVICKNGAATALSVTSNAGSGSITNYQWYSNTSSSNSGGTLVASGASMNSYTPLTTTPGVLYYYVVVTNSNGCTTASAASGSVTVNDIPSITVQPSTTPQNVCNNSTPTTLNVTATAGSGLITNYQWYSNASASNTGGTLVASGGSQTSYTPSSATPGILYYYVVVTNSNGCTTTSNVSGAVTVNALPQVTTQPSVAPQVICKNGAATAFSVTANAGSGSITNYQWYSNTNSSNGGGTLVASGASMNSYTPLTTTPGVLYYYVVVTNSNGCTTASAASGSVTVNDIPSISVQPSTTPQSVCNNSTPTALNVIATAGSGSITNYQWYSNASASNTSGTLVASGGSQTSYTPSNASPGILYYYVVVTNTNGCTTISNVSGAVTVNALPQVTTQPSVAPQVICKNGAATALSVTANAGSGSITNYQWYSNTSSSNSGGTLVASGASMNSYTPITITPGVLYYYVVVSNSNGCTTASAASGSVTVNDIPTVTIQPSTLPQVVCNNATPTPLTINAIPGSGTISAYQWYSNTVNANAGGSVIAGANSTSLMPAVTSTGTLYYYVVVTNSNGCTASSATSGSITINPAPVISVQPTSLSQSVCVNNPALSVSATAAGSVLTFQWYSNTVASNSGGTPIPGATSSVFTPSSSQVGTKYFYVIITTDLGCSITSSVSGALTVNPLPVATISYPGTPFCATGTASVLHTGQGGGSYSAAPGLSINTATGQLNLGASVPGNYLITYSFSNPVTGCVNTTTTNIVVKPMPLAQINGTLSICATSNLSLNAADAGSGASYDWSGPFGFIVNGPALNVNNVSSSSAGNYTLAVTISGCTSTASSLVTVKPLPVAFINGANSICEASSVTLAASNAGAGATYAWAGPSGYNSNSQSIDLNAIPLSYNGIYTLTVTLNGCTSVATHNLLVKPLPVAQISGANNICEATTLQLIAADAGNTASYVWNGPSNFSATTNSITINNVTAATAGTYGVIVTLNGCVASTSTPVIIRPLPIAQINGQTTICEKETLSLTATDAGSDAVYVWSYNNTQQSIQNNLTIPNAVPSKSGTYTLVVSRLGCSKQTTADVLVKPLPLATIIGNSVFCEASTLSLSAADAGNGAAYNWILPNNANIAAQNISLPNIQLIQAGSYTLITTKNGCMNSAVQTVAITPLPLAVINGVTTICESSPLNLIASDAGAGSNYTWLTPSGAIVNNRTLKIIQMALNSGGDYTLTVTKNGCQKQAAKTISIKPLANGTLTAVDALCETETLNLNASSPDPAATFSWTGPVNYAANGATTSIPNITPNYTGTFILGITKDGCTRYIDKAILVKPLPVTLINGKQALCEGTQLTLDAADAGATASYKWTRNQSVLGLNKQLILNNASLNDAGEYKLTVTLQGCSDETMKKVAVDKTPVVQIDPVNPVCQFYPSYVVTANELTGLAGKGEFSGTVISKDGTVNPVRSGDYVINYKYTAANGCVTSQSKTIKIYPGVLVNAGVDKIQLNDEGTQLTSTITGKYNNLLWTNLTNPDASNPSPFVKPLNTTTYTISIQNEFGCMAKDEVVVKVIYLRIPNAFSPNADGTHDKWIIPDLQDFTNCQVEIFNRWGQRMFISKGYKEPWDGTVGGQPAATGTYYYIINLNDKPRKPFAGWLQLLR